MYHCKIQQQDWDVLMGLWIGGGFNAYILGVPKDSRFLENWPKRNQIDFGLDPALYILSILPDKRMDGDVIHLFRIMLFIAKIIIKVCWLILQPPNIMQWRVTVKKVFTMEKITARLQLNVHRFQKKEKKRVLLSPILTLLGGCDAPKHESTFHSCSFHDVSIWEKVSL